MGEKRLRVQQASDKVSSKAVTAILPCQWKLGCSEQSLYRTVNSVSLDFSSQDWYDDVKSFSEQHDYDGLVVLLSITAKHPPGQQVAVFSYHTDLLNQVLTEIRDVL